MSDASGDDRVDSSDAPYDDAENDGGWEDTGRSGLSFGAMLFWVFAVFLILLAICVLVTIILALTNGA